MRHSLYYAGIFVVVLSFHSACTSKRDFGAGGSSNSSVSTGDPEPPHGAGSGGAGGEDTIGQSSGSVGVETDPANCHTGPDDDADGDGWTSKSGDCNDCNAAVNPDAAEVVGAIDADGSLLPPQDEDCDGVVDNVPVCDEGLVMSSSDPHDVAKAVDLCPPLNPRATWGVQNAEWVRADGSPMTLTDVHAERFHLGHGLLDKFGVNTPRRGATMLALSSGTARDSSQPDYEDPWGEGLNTNGLGYVGDQPPGYPKESPSCGNAVTGALGDDTGVTLTIKTPSNAHGLAFDFAFFTWEWPGFVCQTYNDFFIANLSPAPAAHPDGDISFDSQGNPISVNNSLLTVCGPPGQYGMYKKKQFDCPDGTAALVGTGFEEHGATSWLSTRAPVAPGQTIKIRWTVYNSGDHMLQSTTLIDNWEWIANSGVDTSTAPVIK